ncbi:MAG TPA: DoxX family protein [Fimbriimonas sp.]|nr:DoxX family protein [Fimbriimonas sp.]
MSSTTRTDIGLLILRIAIGLTATYYGCQKLLGVFGGPGVKGTMDYMQHSYGIPPIMAILAMFAEFFGGLGMIVGLLTPVAAFGFACVMAVATFENWKTPDLFQHVFTKADAGDPVKVFYTFSLLGAALCLVLLGGGNYSLDAKVFGRKKKATK